MAELLFTALGFGILAAGLWRRAPAAVVMLASLAAFSALAVRQWSPLLVGTALLGPGVALGAMAAAKPTIGLALFAAYPRWRVAAGAAAVGIVSLLAMPDWPIRWLDALSAGGRHMRPPILHPVGMLLLLGLTRWRLPEGRLLAALAVIPHSPAPYEWLVLALIPRGRIEWVLLMAATWAFPAGFRAAAQGGTAWWVEPIQAVLVFGPHLSMLTLVLLRRTAVADDDRRASD